MFLHEQQTGPRPVQRDPMDAMAHLSLGVGNVLRLQPAIDRLPGLTTVIAAEGPGGRNGDVNPFRVARVEQDRVQAHSARSRLPFRSCPMAAQTGELLPGTPAVRR